MANNRIESDVPNSQVVSDSPNQLDTGTIMSQAELKDALAAVKAQAGGEQALPGLTLTDSGKDVARVKQPGNTASMVQAAVDEMRLVKNESDTDRDGYMSREELEAYVGNHGLDDSRGQMADKILSKFDTLDNLRYGFWRDNRIGDEDLDRYQENSVIAALAKDGEYGASSPKFILNSGTVLGAVAGFDGSASRQELRDYALNTGNYEHLRRTAAVLLENYDNLSLGTGHINRETINRTYSALSPDLATRLEELNSDPANHDDHALERAAGGALLGGAIGSMGGRGSNFGLSGAIIGGAAGAASAESEWERASSRLRSDRSHLRATGLFQMDSQPLLGEK